MSKKRVTTTFNTRCTAVNGEAASSQAEKAQHTVLWTVSTCESRHYRCPVGGETAWPQVTHRLEELEWADGASYMDGGRVVVSGTVDRVRAHLRGLGAPV